MSADTSEIFEFNKILFIYAITIIVTGLWIIDTILYKRAIMKHWLFIPVLAFLASQVLSTLFSIDFHTSLFGYYGRFNGGLVSIIAYILLFFVAVNIFQKKDIIQLLKVSLLSSAIVILWGMPGRFGHDMSCLWFTGEFSNACWTDQFKPAERMFSTLGQPNWLGAYLAIHFFIGMYFMLVVKDQSSEHSESHKKDSDVSPLSKVLPYFYSLYIVLNFIAILFTRSRSALGAVGIAGIFFIVGLYFIKKEYISHYAKKYIVVIALLIISVLIFKTGVAKIDRYLDFARIPFQQSSEQSIDNGKPVQQSQPVDSSITDSFDIRKIVWVGAIELGKQYPLFGTGVETFAYSYYFTRPNEHNQTSEWDFLYNKAHNEILNYFATTGFFGTGAYLVMIIAVFAVGLQIFKKSNLEEEKLFVLSMLSAYATIHITNFLGFSITSVNIFFYIIPAFFLIKHISITHEKEISTKKAFSSASFFKQLGVAVMSLCVLFLLLKVNAYRRADMLYAQSNQYIAANDYQTALTLLDDALKLRYEHVYEDKLSSVLANISYVAFYQKDQELATKLRNLSEGYNKKSIAASSKNVLYWKTAGKNDYIFYQMTDNEKDIEDGIKSLEQASILAPTDVKILHSIALFHYTLMIHFKDANPEAVAMHKESAIKLLNKSLQMKPGYIEALELMKQVEGN